MHESFVLRTHLNYTYRINTVATDLLLQVLSGSYCLHNVFVFQPFADGAFQKGDMFNAREGRFHVPKDGIYQFTANLHLHLRTKRKLKGRKRHDEHLRIFICIDSLCETNT